MDLFGTAGGLWTNYKNQEFAEEMASTQYQRATADMKAAGLNPMVMFGPGGSGSPAASPSGQMTNPVGQGSTAKAALEIATAFDQADTVAAQTQTAKANSEIAKSNAELTKAENRAYTETLGTQAGRAGAAKQRYGWAGAAGSVQGTAEKWGGHASAKAKEWWEKAAPEFGSDGAVGASAKAATDATVGGSKRMLETFLKANGLELPK